MRRDCSHRGHRPDLIPQSDPTVWRRTNDAPCAKQFARFAPTMLRDNRCGAASLAIALLAATPGQRAVAVPMFRDGLCARADALVPFPAGGYILRETC